MPKTPSKLIPTMWPLPGGNSRYLNTLDQILKWAANTADQIETAEAETQD